MRVCVSVCDRDSLIGTMRLTNTWYSVPGRELAGVVADKKAFVKGMVRVREEELEPGTQAFRATVRSQVAARFPFTSE